MNLNQCQVKIRERKSNQDPFKALDEAKADNWEPTTTPVKAKALPGHTNN